MKPNQDPAPWELRPEDVEKRVMGNQFEDCLSCRITGVLLRLHISIIQC